MKKLIHQLTRAGICASIALLPALSYAADFTVTKTEDTNDGTCDADCSLREAVIAANASLDGDNTIILSEGTYTLTIAGNDNEAAVGDLDFIYPQDNMMNIATAVTIQGVDAKNTIIDASELGDRAFHAIANDELSMIITLNDLTIQNGLVDANGGAVYFQAEEANNSQSSNLVLNRVHIHNNTSTQFGGAIAASYIGGVNITDSSFTSNTSLLDGGALFIQSVSGMSLRSSTFSGNTARDGGAIGIIGSTNPVTLAVIYNTTITNNVANDDAGGIAIDDNLDLQFSNSIIAGNTAVGLGPDCLLDVEASLTSYGYNVIGNTSDCNFPMGGEGDQLDIDPQLLPLNDNGGPAPTHALTQESPAYNTGNPTSCNNGASPGPTTDQRGQDRVLDGRCDVGAYEAGQADIEVSKSVDKNEVMVGENVTYTITVKNNGPDVASLVKVEDTLPINFTFVSATPDKGSCKHENQVVTCEIPLMTDQETVEIEIVATAAKAGDTTNIAVATGSEIDLDPGDNESDGVDVKINPDPEAADLKVVKKGSEPQVLLGQEFSYTITVTNLGPATANNVTVIDNVPTELSIVSFEPNADCMQNGQEVKCTNPNPLPPDNMTEYVVTITVKAEELGVVENTAIVEADENDPDIKDSESTEETEIVPEDTDTDSDLQVEKTVNKEQVLVGEEFSYSIVTTNLGPNKNFDVVVTDEVPEQLQIVAVQPEADCQVTGQLVECTNPVLLKDESYEVVITVKALTAGVFTNTASAAGSENDPDPDNSDSSTDVFVQPLPGNSDLEIQKDVSKTEVAVNEEFNYTLTISNQGPDDNANVTVIDNVPAGLTIVSANSDDANCSIDQNSNTVECNIANLPNNESVVITITVFANESGQYINSASVSSGTVNDPDPDNSSSSVGVDVNDAGTFLEGSGIVGSCSLSEKAQSNTSSLVLACLAMIAIAGWTLRRKQS